ncbi:chorismate mutase [Gracilibacillus sp. Marseille-QA3620]
MLRGIRGAITVSANRKEEIERQTERLMREIIEQNELDSESIASVFISVTDDLDAGFPAASIRRIDGFMYVPVMCMREIPVPESLPLAIRIMVHVNTDKSQREIKHIYLEEAIKLRPDLLEK